MLAKPKLNSIEVLICKSLIDSSFIHDEFVLINNMLKNYDDMRKEIKNVKIGTVNQIFYAIYKTMLSYCLMCRKDTESKKPKFKKIKKGKIMLSSNCAVRGSKTSIFIKEKKTVDY